MLRAAKRFKDDDELVDSARRTVLQMTRDNEANRVHVSSSVSASQAKKMVDLAVDEIAGLIEARNLVQFDTEHTAGVREDAAYTRRNLMRRTVMDSLIRGVGNDVFAKVVTEREERRVVDRCTGCGKTAAEAGVKRDAWWTGVRGVVRLQLRRA